MPDRLATSVGGSVLLAAAAVSLALGVGTAAAETGPEGGSTRSASSDGPNVSERETRSGTRAATHAGGSQGHGDSASGSDVEPVAESNPPDIAGPEGVESGVDQKSGPSETDTEGGTRDETAQEDAVEAGGTANAPGVDSDVEVDMVDAPLVADRRTAHPLAPRTPRSTASTDRDTRAISAPVADVKGAVSAETGPDFDGQPVEKIYQAALVAEPPSRSAVTTAAVSQAPRSVDGAPSVQKFVNAVGSSLLNALMGLIQLFAGPPVLPANSNVTVRTSMLTIPVGSGRKVMADWYFPESGAEPPTRLIYLQHGFGAVSSMYSFNAAALAERTNSIVVAPSITSNFLDPGAVWLGGTPMQEAVAKLFDGDRAALSESALAAAGHEVILPRRFALVGHSLGATLVMGAAGRMVDTGAIDDLAGVVLFDGVDVNNTVPRALDKLTGMNHVPVQNISSERYQWNRYGLLSDELEAARPGEFNGVMLQGGRHIDGLQGGNPILQFAEYVVAGFSESRNIEAIRTLATGWINDMFAGTDSGIYPAPGQSVQIPTRGTAAVAVALPIASTEPVRATPWDAATAALLAALVKVAIYEAPRPPVPAFTGVSAAGFTAGR